MVPNPKEEFVRCTVEEPDGVPQQRMKSNLKGDRLNIALLLVLYTLQSLPGHMAIAIPIVLQKRGVTYNQQAIFSFVSFPFVLKLLWAPVVDSLYFSKFGRRKTWLVPSQYLLGFLMLYMAWKIDDWIGDETGHRRPDTTMLTIMFFTCFFLAATQDVAVDGWSLTMLQKRNVGHSGTCNSVGFAMGSFFGYVLFIVLDSEAFCNKWLRSEPKPYGIMSFSVYMFFWSAVYFITTTFVLFFKKDNSLEIVDETEIEMNVLESYSLFKKILKIKPVQQLCLIVLTCKIGFGAIHSVAPLKLIDAGVPRDTLAMFIAPLIPLQIIVPFVFGNVFTGRKSIHWFFLSIPVRLVPVVLLTVLVYFTTYFKENGELSILYYVLMLIVNGLEQMLTFIMTLTMSAFFSQVSDPRFGGTYLTLLNTVANFGSRWPTGLALFLVEPLTWRSCKELPCKFHDLSTCKPTQICRTIVDGFYIEIALSIVISVLWLIWARKRTLGLQKLKESAWMVERRVEPVKNGLLK